MFPSFRRIAFSIAALTALAVPALTLGATSAAAGTCPSLTYGGTTITDCSTIITINPNLSVSITTNVANGSPYTNNGLDNSGNVLVGVVNHSAYTVEDLYLYGFSNTGSPLFNVVPSETLCATNLGVTSACTAGLPKAGSTGYEGLVIGSGGLAYFVDIGAYGGSPNNYADVIFTNGLGALGSGDNIAYFELASNPASAAPSGVVTVPEPASFLMFGVGLLGFGLIRRYRPVPRLRFA